MTTPSQNSQAGSSRSLSCSRTARLSTLRARAAPSASSGSRRSSESPLRAGGLVGEVSLTRDARAGMPSSPRRATVCARPLMPLTVPPRRSHQGFRDLSRRARSHRPGRASRRRGGRSQLGRAGQGRRGHLVAAAMVAPGTRALLLCGRQASPSRASHSLHPLVVVDHLVQLVPTGEGDGGPQAVRP